MPVAEPKDRVTQSDNELHIGLDIPTATARHIHNWAQKQNWPEGTKLEPAHEYHVTILYTPEGHEEHNDAWWIDHLEQSSVTIAGLDAFDANDEFAYVLRLDAPEIVEHAEEMQAKAEWMGLPVTQFEGGYKPHITVGYGPSNDLAFIQAVPHWSFDVGPSSVSPVRPKESSAPPEPPNYRPATSHKRCGTCKMFDQGICWGYGNKRVKQNATCNSWAADSKTSAERQPYSPESVQILDTLSLANLAHNLHYRFEQGDLDAHGATDYAKRMLRLIGYPTDDITVQAALQAWQQLYPKDEIAPNELAQAPPTIPTKSWGYGTTSGTTEKFAPRIGELSHILRYSSLLRRAKALYHWLDAGDVHDWMDPARTGPGHTYLTESGEDPGEHWNDDVPHYENPVRLTIDTDYLDPHLFDPHYEGWLNNHLYTGPVPPQAVKDIKSFRRPDEWEEQMSTVPSQVNNPEDQWSGWGEDEKHHHEVQISNEWAWRS